MAAGGAGRAWDRQGWSRGVTWAGLQQLTGPCASGQRCENGPWMQLGWVLPGAWTALIWGAARVGRKEPAPATCEPLLWTGVPLQQGVTQAIEIPLPDASAPARFSTGSSWRLKDEPVTGRQGGRPVLEPHMCWGLGTGVRPGPRLQEGRLLVQDGLEVCGQSWVGRCLQDGQCGRWELSAQLCLGCRGTEVSVHNPEDTRGHASRCLQATEGKAGRPSEACCVGAQRPA